MAGSDAQQGPVMLCATKVLNTGPARIGHIAGGITLPRTVEVRVLIAGAVGAFIMFFLSMGIVGLSLRQTMMSLMFGAGIGAMTQKYSPLRGESLFKWMQLETSSRMGRVTYNGEKVKVYVGTCPVRRVAAGKVAITPGAVDVPEGSVDGRGWKLPPGERVFDLAPIRRPAARPASTLIVAPPTSAAPADAPTPSWARRAQLRQRDAEQRPEAE